MTKPLKICKLLILKIVGGETGIRTQVRVTPKHAFQACAFSHSAISPAGFRLYEFNILCRVSAVLKTARPGGGARLNWAGNETVYFG
jgi:hypothetical protein